MKYRTKLYISLVSVALASILLGLTIFSTEAEKFIIRMINSRSLSIVATAVTQLDPELFEKVNTVRSIDDPIYIEAKKKLLDIINANRRDDIYVYDLYTLYPDPKNPDVLLYGAETDEDPDLPGSLYTESDKNLILESINDYFVDSSYVSDQYGVWLSATAPIRDANGKYVATLGVDINVADIHIKLVSLIKFGLYGLTASVVLSLLLAHYLSKKVTLSLDHLCHVVTEIQGGNFEAKSQLVTDDEFGILSKRINAMTVGLKERERLKMSFARYVSKHVLDKILATDHPLKLEGERRKITLLFSDIRQFTKLSEKLPPEDVVHLLNEYFEQMIEVIFSHSGTLDKFIGDGIMAEFGAPLDDDKQEEHAIQAAIHMQKALNALCDKWEKEGRPRVQMGIGIHTGDAVVGNVGSIRRTEYTAIGDAVNVASRLEKATKILHCPILISESTYLGARDRFPFKDLGTMALPGRKEQIRVYTIENT